MSAPGSAEGSHASEEEEEEEGPVASGASASEDAEDAAPATPERRPSRPASGRSGSSGRGRRAGAASAGVARTLAPRPVGGAPAPTRWERSGEESAAISAAFAALDRDGDGSLLPQDIMDASSELGIRFTRPDIYALIGDHDADGEGRIQAAEFEDIAVERARQTDVEGAEYDRLWADFDQAGAGYVDAAALEALFSGLGEDPSRIDVRAMIRDAKQGRDAGTPDEGRVHKDELRHLLDAARPGGRAR